MKKDGFISMTLIYTFLILFLFLMLAILNTYSQQNKYLKAIDSKINLSISTPNIDNYCPYLNEESFNYEFVNNYQTFVAACKGKYKIELWGAQGGGLTSNKGGKGAYTSGDIILEKNDVLYVYVGESPSYTSSNCNSENINAAFNGNVNGGCVGGGGATDIRLVNGEWNDIISLRSRIMVAAGGGGTYIDSENNYVGGAGGGLYGYNGVGGINPGIGGRQISSSFGIGESFSSNGGGGYYGGQKGNESNAGGGSSFISGHIGCVAIGSSQSNSARYNSNNVQCTEETNDIVCSYHYTDKIFTNTVIIDGKGYKWTNEKGQKINMPSYSDNTSIEGNSGNGYAKITYLGE